MKIQNILLLLLVIPGSAFAQEPGRQDHFIEVTGTAEFEIEPNEIYVTVRLKEFEEARQKVLLEKLDKDFLNAIDAAGISRGQVTLADAGVQLGRLRWRQKDAFREKTYQVRLTSATQLEAFIDKVESVKIDFADVTRLSHSDLQKLKLELKVKALQAAKTKAEALLKGIGSELGKPVTVREIELEPYLPAANMRYETLSRANTVLRSFDSNDAEPEIGFKKIKLQAQVSAQFEIK